MRIEMIGLGFLSLLALAVASTHAQEPASVYDFTVVDINGNPVALSDYQGKVLLIVNTASRCGFTPQYKPLEQLYQQYQEKGFVVLGFPANNFLNQEPGSNDEIKEFCALNFNITFPLLAKISVKGADIHPLYAYLTKVSGFEGEITWNFNKFLIGKDGKVVNRFDTRVDPLDPKIITAIEQQL